MHIIDCEVIRLEVKKVSRKDQEAIVFTHSDYKEENDLLVKLYACKQYCKVLQEGHPDQFFIGDSNDGDGNGNGQAEGEVELPDTIMHNNANSSGTTLNENISQMQSQCFFVDDNNLPVSENVPDAITGSSSVSERRINSNDVMQERKHDGFYVSGRSQSLNNIKRP